MQQTTGERPTNRVIRERRRYRRIKVQLPMRWTGPDARANTWIPGDTVNASPAGLLCETDFVPGVRPGLTIAIFLEVDKTEIMAIARIVDIRHSESGPRTVLMALEFTAIQAGDVKALTQRLVAEERRAKRSIPGR